LKTIKAYAIIANSEISEKVPGWYGGEPGAMAHVMRTLLKGLGILPLFLFYVFISGIIRLLPVGRKTKRVVAIRTAAGFARIFLILFSVRVHVKHRGRLHKTNVGHLIVSNHLSYVDVLVLSALIPSVFITSVELKNTVLLGTLARLSGSIFVERRKPSGLKREIEDIVFALGQGLAVVLFPEGTTSNGDRVQLFKNSLFDSAVIAQVNIVPVCLRYTRANNKQITPQNRDNVFYYGGIAFWKHLLRFLSLTSVDVEVVPLKAIRVHPGQSRKDLAAETYQAISEAYHG
jgi:lyso-ornithine lipid O-acyltransferase